MLTLFELSGNKARPDVGFSPFVWRIKLMLAHKGLDYEREFVSFADKSALAGAGVQTVPVLKNGDTWVAESLRIARYLEETFPDKPLFETPLAARQSVILNNWFDQTIVMPIFPMIVSDIYDVLDDENRAAFKATREPRLGGRRLEDMREGRSELREAFKANLGPLEAILSEQNYLSGDAPAFADYCLMGSLMWPHIVTDFDPVADSDLVKAWRARMFDQFDGLARSAPRAA